MNKQIKYLFLKMIWNFLDTEYNFCYNFKCVQEYTRNTHIMW